MLLHANAKLGLAGRLALVRAVEEGRSLRAAAAAFNVSPATAHRWWHRWLEAGEEAGERCRVCLIARAGRIARRGSSRRSSQERICACRRETGWGPRLVAGRDRLRALDRLEGAEAGRHLAAAASGQGAGQPVRVALPRRPAAHGHKPLRALPAARPRASPATARSAHATGCGPRRGSATTTRTRSSTTTPGSPTSSSTTTRRPRPSPASSNARSPSSPTTGSPSSG